MGEGGPPQLPLLIEERNHRVTEQNRQTTIFNKDKVAKIGKGSRSVQNDVMKSLKNAPLDISTSRFAYFTVTQKRTPTHMHHPIIIIHTVIAISVLQI